MKELPTHVTQGCAGPKTMQPSPLPSSYELRAEKDGGGGEGGKEGRWAQESLVLSQTLQSL